MVKTTWVSGNRSIAHQQTRTWVKPPNNASPSDFSEQNPGFFHFSWIFRYNQPHHPHPLTSQESLGFLAPDPRAGHGRRRRGGSEAPQDAAAFVSRGAGGLADDPSSDDGGDDGCNMFTRAGGDGDVWLVGGDWNMTVIFPYIGNVIIPID